jgi:aminopeptidase N
VSGGARALSPRTILRAAYEAPHYLVERIGLIVDLDPQQTRVAATLRVRRAAGVPPEAPLVLQGEEQDLQGVRIDGSALTPDQFALSATTLTIARVPAQFTLEIESVCNPAANTALEGLYLTSGVFCTQCEPEGFRRITYFPDRPDVLAEYTVELRADPTLCPVLLSNGDRVAEGALPDGRRYARWHDPWPKPSYLFALVAGDMGVLEDEFVTARGKRVALQIYSTASNLPRCAHAMSALKAAMRWDEETHGREYDLGRFMIYCADDFNMGAMENKGLNIFNARALLTAPERSTDDDYAQVEAIVAHEYFHNWTGNRVTCRDWFQLSLKEGWTVFRDQEFSADRGSRAVERIGQMLYLREQQWPEDAGPQAHPVRPDAYVEINNFYTATVYDKGAEVIRMLHGLIGPEAYRRGSDLYFARHDGQAVTCEDFVAAMADASGRDLTQFRRWYDQAGTPVVRVEADYDPAARQLRLTFAQSCPPTPGQPHKLPLHVPLRLALLGTNGAAMPLQRAGEAAADGGEQLIELTEALTTVTFVGVHERPVPSLLRGFSAPVRLQFEPVDDVLLFLLRHDTDLCSRWEAMQHIQYRAIAALLDGDKASGGGHPSATLIAAFRIVLDDDRTDPAWRALALRLPAFADIADRRPAIDSVSTVNVERIDQALRAVKAALAATLHETWSALYDRYQQTHPYAFTAAAAGRRALANRALGYLTIDAPGRQRAVEQFHLADNMTDCWGAMVALNDTDCPERQTVIAEFRRRWHDDPLLLDKWLTLEATSAAPGRLATIAALWNKPGFDHRNPNRVRALLHAFAQRNWPHFHQKSGAAYAFIADQVLLLDRQNPQLSARLAQAFDRWRKFDPVRRDLMRTQLERIAAAPGLSGDVGELVMKALSG